LATGGITTGDSAPDASRQRCFWWPSHTYEISRNIDVPRDFFAFCDGDGDGVMECRFPEVSGFDDRHTASNTIFARKIEHYGYKDRFYEQVSGEPLTFPASARENARYFEH
jgi:hypothetical protein